MLCSLYLNNSRSYIQSNFAFLKKLKKINLKGDSPWYIKWNIERQSVCKVTFTLPKEIATI